MPLTVTVMSAGSVENPLPLMVIVVPPLFVVELGDTVEIVSGMLI